MACTHVPIGKSIVGEYADILSRMDLISRYEYVPTSFFFFSLIVL